MAQIPSSIRRLACLLVAASALPTCASQPAEPAAPVAPAASAAAKTPITLSLLSINDLHGRIEPLPRIGGLVANVRRARAADGGAVLLVDGGDTFQGELASNLSEGATVVDAYNVLGFDAAAVGNHEFDFGPVGPRAAPAAGDNPRGALIARAAQAKYPFLAANLIDQSTGKPFAAPNIVPSTIVTVSGVKVGLVGLLTLETTLSVLASVFAGLKLDPLEQALTREAAQLRAQGATVVIAVAHAGGGCKTFESADDLSSCEADAEIFKVARAVAPGTVDAIVAGHTHARVAHRVNGIPIIESGAHGEALSRLDLVVDPQNGKVIEHRLFPPFEVCTRAKDAESCAAASYEGALVTEDPRVAAIVAPALKAAADKLNEPLGITVAAPIARATGTESVISNLVADLMSKARPKSDVTLMHAGGLRANLDAGPLTYGDFFEVYPRDSTFATTTLTGAELARALEGNFTGHGGSLVSVSGVRVTARCEKGALAVTLKREDGRVIKPADTLVVTTNNLLATGAKGNFGGKPWQVEDDPPIREELVRVLKERGGVLSPTDKALLDPKNPRVALPQPAPVRCEQNQPLTEKP